MKPHWIDRIGLADLPEDFQDSALAMAESILPLLGGDRELAERVAVECVKSDLAEFEGTDRYYPKFAGDKFCPARHEAIREDYWRQLNSGEFELHNFISKWNITERTLRSVKSSGPDPRQSTIPGLD